jgi:heat shock protein beta
MRKRLVRKAFDMILGISMSDNKEVWSNSGNLQLESFFHFSCKVVLLVSSIHRNACLYPVNISPAALFCVQDYEKFWENFGKHLKLGCIEDRENHKRIAPLLRFYSSQSDEWLISLDEYVENMKPDQKDIYYIAADSVNSAKNTPFLEKLTEKDLEVL